MRLKYHQAKTNVVVSPHRLISSNMTQLPQSEFDYIVIGGGTGVLTVASRLSEDASTSVLLIEAGLDRTGDPRIETPGLLTTLYGDPDFDWDFLSEPQAHINGRQIP